MAADVAGEIVSLLDTANVGIVLRRTHAGERGMAVRRGNNGYMMKTYSSLDENAKEMFCRAADAVAAQAYAFAKMESDERGLEVVYVKLPYERRVDGVVWATILPDKAFRENLTRLLQNMENMRM